jgi:hypothetical protein
MTASAPTDPNGGAVPVSAVPPAADIRTVKSVADRT